MKIIDKSHIHFEFDRNMEPVLSVTPGEEVVFETLDACCGEVRTLEQFLARRETDRKSDPLTGPAFVEGAYPGDTLVVEILKIEPDASGFQLIGPDRAIIRDEVPDWTCYEVRVDGDTFSLPCGLEFPVNPTIGAWGNAPKGEPTHSANRCGGTLDAPEVCTGVKLHIPVAVPGALFSLGDVHACQGDGEVVGAPEIGARVTVRFEVLKRGHEGWSMIEDDTHWHTPRAAETEAEAARQAVFQNARFIAAAHNVEFKDALVFLTMAGRLSMSLTGWWGQLQPVVCSSFSKRALAEAVTHHRRG